MFKYFLIASFISGIFMSQVPYDQKDPLPAPNFGRVFGERSDFSLNGNSKLTVCSNTSKFGFIQRSGTNRYYAVADLMMKWIDAENYCQSFGAHLPVVKSQADTDFLRCLLDLKYI